VISNFGIVVSYGDETMQTKNCFQFLGSGSCSGLGGLKGFGSVGVLTGVLTGAGAVVVDIIGSFLQDSNQAIEKVFQIKIKFHYDTEILFVKY
jgi:hypothetical protein